MDPFAYAISVPDVAMINKILANPQLTSAILG